MAITGCPNLPDNHNVALSRLTSLGRRLTKDPVTHAKYKNKINEMLALDDAFKVTTEEHVEGKTWYIPHHCTSGNFGVVFDCAAIYKGTSFNAQLLQGPDNMDNLIGVLFRFRLHSIAINGDICNMFHQVHIYPSDQSALKFLWWGDGNPKLLVKIYQLTVHTFGLISSPSIASFALRRTAEENRVICSEEAVETIKRYMYVDDLLTSVKSCEEGIHLVREFNALLESNGF